MLLFRNSFTVYPAIFLNKCSECVYFASQSIISIAIDLIKEEANNKIAHLCHY